MNILMAAAECVPFAKTGGLADVAGALPKALKRRRQDVRLVLPRYRQVDVKAFGLRETGRRVRVPVGDRVEEAAILEGRIGREVPVYFLEHDHYFNREHLYRSPDGDYPDNAERFIFYSRAVLETAKAVDFVPDVIHCHDWQTGLIPAYLRTAYRLDAFFQNTASAYTIHNIAYQGLFPVDTLYLAGFGWSEFTPERLEYYGQMSFMKAGLVFADVVSTVSRTYAKEIQSGEEFGRGLEGVLRARARDLYGIVNGIDVEEWNPEKDPHLPARFSARGTSGKAACKAALQAEVGLARDPAAPLAGVVSRLDPQKGLDLLEEAVPGLMSSGVQIVILGTGDRACQERLAALAKQHPGRLVLILSFNNPLAHRIYAGSDLFLMPSRFEPCGLGQMIAMRYGTVPVVMKTGGLVDTVRPVQAETGTGFVMGGPTPQALLAAVRDAVTAYRNPRAWGRLVATVMRENFSWNVAVREYLALYRASLAHLRA